MKSKLKAMFDDDRGVSPVIGVILMVAITVILAAVIGTFVLGLGDSLNQAPQAQLDATSTADDSGNNSNVTLSHDGGDALTRSEINVSWSNSNGNATTDLMNEEFGVGDSAVVVKDAEEGGTLTVIHNPSQSVLFEQDVDV